MSTTVLRLAGPLAAWPGPAKYRSRLSSPIPTYSMVAGLLGALLGVPREAPLPETVQPDNVGIRIERPGRVLRDFHTVNPYPDGPFRWLNPKDRVAAQARVVKASGNRHLTPVVTERFYREDSELLVFVADEDGAIARAAKAPQWAVYAGRKSCTVSFPFFLGTVPTLVPETTLTFPSTAPEGKLTAVLFEKPAEGALEAIPLAQHKVAGQFVTRSSFTVHTDPVRYQNWLTYLEERRVA